MLREVPLAEIVIGPRHRRDMGDLESLADSMGELGLLQPIGITEDHRLVFGERRVKAAEMLGWTTIPARVVHLSNIVAGEYAENEIRKDFTPSERVAIDCQIEGLLGKRQGQRTDLELPDNCPEVGSETRDLARAVGATPRTRLAEALAQAGDRSAAA